MGAVGIPVKRGRRSVRHLNPHFAKRPHMIGQQREQRSARPAIASPPHLRQSRAEAGLRPGRQGVPGAAHKGTTAGRGARRCAPEAVGRPWTGGSARRGRGRRTRQLPLRSDLSAAATSSDRGQHEKNQAALRRSAQRPTRTNVLFELTVELIELDSKLMQKALSAVILKKLPTPDPELSQL